MPADLLIAGHLVKDIDSDGWRPGGSVAYAAVQARALALQVTALTVCSEDVNPSSIVSEVDWHVGLDAETTTFENHYQGGRREQRLLARARPLDASDLPEGWQETPLILFATVFHDVDPDLPRLVAAPERLVGLAAQGWLRRLDGDRVLPTLVEPNPPWLAGDVVFVSEEDVANPEAVSFWLHHVPFVCLTRSEKGCTLWDRKGRHDLPAFETNVVDPTGAGDVFAAAFLIRLAETRDPVVAGRFANAAAALSVRQVGPAGIAGRSQIQALVQSGTGVTAA